MRYKEYGKTGKLVSNLGFGAMRFDPPDDEENAIKTVHKAVELGINYFDTAPGYCRDNSETFLGKALSMLPQEKQVEIYVSTKSSLSSDGDADAVRKRIDDQLKKLRRDRITFYNMWCVMDLEQYGKIMAPGGPYEGALKAKEEGLIEHLAFSAHARGDEIAKMVVDDRNEFQGVTLGYNILNHRLRKEGMVAAHKAGLAVMTMNPLGGGMLCHSEEKLGFLAEDESDHFIAASLRFIFSHPEVTVVLSGMGKPEHVEFNVGVANSVEGADPEVVERIIEKYDRLGDKFCTGCRYCLDDCPEEMQIHMLMRLADCLRMGMNDEAKRLYELFSNNAESWLKNKYAKDCTECGSCEELCTQQLPIREYMSRVTEFFGEK
ncbi:MAG: aldo/keto reductase [Planctomycetota bacterium]|jgi:predicted aldo/keto reductase-like oxidoreductase